MQEPLTAASFPEKINHPFQNSDNWGWQAFNEIVGDIRKIVTGLEFKRKMYARKESLKRGFESSKEYVDELFNRYSRILVMRVDFSYNPKMVNLFNEITLKDVRRDFEKFLNNKRSKELYRNMVGYIWRLEYGEKKGFHYHLFFFFDGAKSHKDIFLVSEIGRHWESITGGLGRYHNCNANKQYYKRLAIGMISHDDQKARDTIVEVLHYMHKETQLLKEKLLAKARTWGRGEMPSAISKRLGRPRRGSCVHS